MKEKELYKLLIKNKWYYFDYISLCSMLANVNEGRLAKRLNLLAYHNFLKTPYWNCIRDHVVSVAFSTCAACGHKGKSVVHHRRYKHHGYEHKHLEDLICLCKQCHDRHHDSKDTFYVDSSYYIKQPRSKNRKRNKKKTVQGKTNHLGNKKYIKRKTVLDYDIDSRWNM